MSPWLDGPGMHRRTEGIEVGDPSLAAIGNEVVSASVLGCEHVEPTRSQCVGYMLLVIIYEIFKFMNLVLLI